MINITEAPFDYYDNKDDSLSPYNAQNFDPYKQYLPNGRQKRELVTLPRPPQPDCVEPPSYVETDVVSISVLYRIVYWTTQLLTWFLIPFLSAYVQAGFRKTTSNVLNQVIAKTQLKAGEFTVLQKAKTALIDNAIYYGTYVLIFVILLIYVSISTQYKLSFSNLKLIGITAANTWGLFLLGEFNSKFFQANSGNST